MSEQKKITTSSIIRVAGNIASGMVGGGAVPDNDQFLVAVAEASTKLAYLVVAEVEKCERFR